MSEQNATPAQPPLIDDAPDVAEATPESVVEATPESAAPPTSEGKSKKFLWIGVVAVVAVVLVGLGAFLVRGLLDQGNPATAKPGDCIAGLDAPKEGETADAGGAKLVDCAASEAKFTVIGRVDNTTKEKFDTDPAGELKICKDAGHKDSEYMLWANDGGSNNGHVLCLIDKK